MKKVVVICYPNDWHWVLSMEFLNSQLATDESIEVWDLSWAGESGLKNTLKQLVGGNTLQRYARNLLKQRNIRVIKPSKNRHSKQKSMRVFDEISTKFETLNPIHHRTIFNTCVELVGDLRVNIEKNEGIIRNEILASQVVRDFLDGIDQNGITQVVTVNGRFTKNATVKEWSQASGHNFILLEFGSNEEKYEEFEVSPHSVSEVARKMFIYWDSADLNERNQVASQYLESLVKGKTTKIDWRKKIEEHQTPKFSEGRKICVFFTSTESEHAGLGDEVAPGEFENQVEAFRGLVDVLPKDTWDIYLRRHPRNPNLKGNVDPEEHLWEEFYKLSNVIIIEPDSPIDSIEIGVNADLVANYWSTIAIELLARGQEQVITLGHAPWNRMIPSHSTRNRDEIERFLTNPSSRIRIEDLYPWAFYYATFGKPFQLFYFDSKIGKWLFRLS